MNKQNVGLGIEHVTSGLLNHSASVLVILSPQVLNGLITYYAIY